MILRKMIFEGGAELKEGMCIVVVVGVEYSTFSCWERERERKQR